MTKKHFEGSSARLRIKKHEMEDGAIMILDAALETLARAPLHPQLGSIDDAVLAGLGARLRQGGISNGSLGVAACAALAIGVAGAALPSEPAGAASLTPLGSPLVLAPSTLLASAE